MKPDKDKVQKIVLASLFVAILGIGAFQFVGSGSEPPPKKAKKAASAAKKLDGDAVKVEPESEFPPEIRQLVARELPVRDPFVQGLAALEPSNPTPPAAPEPKIEQPPSNPRPGKAPTGWPKVARRAAATADEASSRVYSGAENLTPMVPPLPGALPASPGAVASGAATPEGEARSPAEVRVEPGKILRQPNEFAYSLVGIVVGERPLAVLQSDDGVQKLVKLGAAVDGDSRVSSIGRRSVTVEHRGKRITLKLGGNP